MAEPLAEAGFTVSLAAEQAGDFGLYALDRWASDHCFCREHGDLDMIVLDQDRDFVTVSGPARDPPFISGLAPPI